MEDLQSIDWTIDGFGFLLVANYKFCLVKANCSIDGIHGVPKIPHLHIDKPKTVVVETVLVIFV